MQRRVMAPLRLRDLGATVVLGPGLVVPMIVWHGVHTMQATWPRLTRRAVALCERYPDAVRALLRHASGTEH